MVSALLSTITYLIHLDMILIEIIIPMEIIITKTITELYGDYRNHISLVWTLLSTIKQFMHLGIIVIEIITHHYGHYIHQGPDFDDMSSFFLCEIDDAIQYINLGYGPRLQKKLFYNVFFCSFCVVFKF